MAKKRTLTSSLLKKRKSVTLKKRSVSAAQASAANSKKIYQDIVYCFMQMLNTIKLYHWKTFSYATHKATDQLYADLNTKVDDFVEVLLGKNLATRSFILNINSLHLPSFTLLENSNNNGFKREIDKYKMFLIQLTNNPQLGHPSNSDLLAIRDEILALLNQFLYLLTLN